MCTQPLLLSWGLKKVNNCEIWCCFKEWAKPNKCLDKLAQQLEHGSGLCLPLWEIWRGELMVWKGWGLVWNTNQHHITICPLVSVVKRAEKQRNELVLLWSSEFPQLCTDLRSDHELCCWLTSSFDTHTSAGSQCFLQETHLSNPP